MLDGLSRHSFSNQSQRNSILTTAASKHKMLDQAAIFIEYSLEVVSRTVFSRSPLSFVPPEPSQVALDIDDGILVPYMRLNYSKRLRVPQLFHRW